MECIFINLDETVDRRALIERNFAAIDNAGWRLTRFPAISKGDVEKYQVVGGITPAEKACFFSHRSVLQSRLHGSEPIMIVEDDVMFHKDTLSIVDNMVNHLSPPDWDLIFLDICVPDVKFMIDLYRGMKARPTDAHFSLVDLRTVMFGGSTAYVVNGRSKHKLSRLLDFQRYLITPYDLHLRELIRFRQLNAYVVFPFISSLSHLSETSTVSAESNKRADKVWNQFRRLMWIGRDLHDLSHLVEEQFASLCDDEMRAIAMIVGTSLALEQKITVR